MNQALFLISKGKGEYFMMQLKNRSLCQRGYTESSKK
jgi:hypothetical protein